MVEEVDYQNGIKSPKASGLFAYDESTGMFIPAKTDPDGNQLVRESALANTMLILDGNGDVKTTLSDILPVVYRNIQASADYTNVLTSELTQIDLTLANHTGKSVAATAIVVACAGGSAFKGVYVAINKTAGGAATALTQAAAPTTANVAHHKETFFVPAGSTVLIPYNETLGLVHLLADDTDASESNVVQVSPL